MPALTPTQEHYLKRELLKLEIDEEFKQLNDGLALRKFGYPFTSQDPTKLGKSGHTTVEKDLSSDGPYSEDLLEFPLSKHFLTKFILTIPFFSQDHQNYEEFWVKKVQVFYEKFVKMNMSESVDREELTKRKKMAHRVAKLFLMVYNSGIGTTNELQYYTTDKKLEVGESTHESQRLEKLILPSKKNLKDYLSQGKFINGLNINIVGVRLVKKQVSNTLWNSISTTLGKNESYYEYIIKTRVDLNESEYVFVGRRYHDFRDLHHKLRQMFPGKHLPSLPSKVKSNISFGIMSDGDDDDDLDLDEKDELDEERLKDNELQNQMTAFMNDLKLNTFSSQNSESKPSTSSNNGSLQEAPRTPKSPKSTSFMKATKLPWKALTSPKKSTTKHHQSNSTGSASSAPREKTRVGLRAYLRELLEDVEISNCECLKEFLYKGKIIHLSEDEKKDIQTRENLDLLLLLNQVKFQNESFLKITALKKSSLPLRAKVLETESGLIEIFEEFKEKEHIYDLSPMLKNFIDWCKIELAATIYQLFLGNDNSYELYSQVKRAHKLMPYALMVNILKFTNPMGIMKAMMDLLMVNPFGGKSLLQTLFYGILADDIKSQAKVINDLEEKINNEQIIKRLKYFVFECDDYNLRQIIKEESKELSTEILLTVVISPHLNDIVPIDDEHIGMLFESYKEFKKFKNASQEEIIFINQEKTAYYSNLRDLYKLYLKTHDKEILQQIWSQPDLILILKDLFTMFYQPLVNLFKNARIDIAFRHFQRFMDDLIELIDRLSMDIYINDAPNIVDDIMQCINNHEDEFYQFLHQVYVNDKEHIFEDIISWISSIINYLRKGKNNEVKINLEELLTISKDVNIDELLSEINAVIESVRKRHDEFLKKQEELTEKAKQKAAPTDLMSEKWDDINSNINIFSGKDFGLHDHDLYEFQGGDYSSDEAASSKLTNDETHMELKTDEIQKLLDGFKAQLINVLKA